MTRQAYDQPCKKGLQHPNWDAITETSVMQYIFSGCLIREAVEYDHAPELTGHKLIFAAKRDLMDVSFFKIYDTQEVLHNACIHA